MNGQMAQWLAVLLGQMADGGDVGAESTKAVTAGTTSVWDFMVKGGLMMIPIALCSLVALTVIMERLLTLRRRKIIPPAFLPGLKGALQGDSDDLPKALGLCTADGSPLAVVLGAAIRALSEPIERLEKHIERAGQRVVTRLRKHLRVLSVIASIAPLMGLLGTIFGMIHAFQTVAVSGEALGKTELLAKGIYEAMITTAAGLLVTIPVLVCYHWLSSRIDQLVIEIDHITVGFVEEYAAGYSTALGSGSGEDNSENDNASRATRAVEAA